MFGTKELAGFSREERDIARAQYQEAITSLDIFERKLHLAWLDERLSSEQRKFIKKLWHGARGSAQLSLGNRDAREAYATAMILAHIEFTRQHPQLMHGRSRARLLTLAPNAGLMPIDAFTVPLAQLRGYSDRAVRITHGNALLTLDLALFCPARGAAVDTAGVHVHATYWTDDQHFKPTKAAKAMGAPGGTTNMLDAPIAIIKTRGAKEGGVLRRADVAGLGRYGSKMSCGVNTCFMSAKGTRSECSLTDWHLIDALRQLEFWCHVNALDACWAVGEGRALRASWRRRLLAGTIGSVSARVPIAHDALSQLWQAIWTALGVNYKAIAVKS